MSAAIAWLLSNLTTIIPAILGVLGIAYGSHQKGKKEYAEAEAALAKTEATAEKANAEIAHEMLDVVIKHDKNTKKVIKDAVDKAKLDRSDFFN